MQNKRQDKAFVPHMQDFMFFTAVLNEHTTSSRFLVIDDRYVGLALTGAMEDDRLCVILGCNVPFIARPVGSSRYWLAGNCHVRALMCGEGMRDGEFKVVMFYWVFDNQKDATSSCNECGY